MKALRLQLAAAELAIQAANAAVRAAYALIAPAPAAAPETPTCRSCGSTSLRQFDGAGKLVRICENCNTDQAED